MGDIWYLNCDTFNAKLIYCNGASNFISNLHRKKKDESG